MRLVIGSIFFMFMTSVFAENADDPWEGWNRQVFEFNDTLDKYAAKPVAQAYRNVTPQVVDDAISNVFSNLGEPLVVVNDLLQFKFKQAASDTGRFLINSTIGLLGIFDVAKHIGLEKHQEDIGQTLGYWGVESGPYLVLPVLGPSTVRDASGLAVEFYGLSEVDAMRQAIEPDGPYYSAVFAKYLDIRGDLIPAEGIISGDRYSFVRSLYLQRRDYLIKDGVIEDEFSEDFEEDWDEEEFEDEESEMEESESDEAFEESI